jgi:hypothetical protein
MEVYDHVRHRLPFLIDRDEDLFRKLDNVYFKDFKGVFAVCYKQDRKGRLDLPPCGGQISLTPPQPPPL